MKLVSDLLNKVPKDGLFRIYARIWPLRIGSLPSQITHLLFLGFLVYYCAVNAFYPSCLIKTSRNVGRCKGYPRNFVVSWHGVGDNGVWLNFRQTKQRPGRATVFKRRDGNSDHLIPNSQCWVLDPGSPDAAFVSAWCSLVSWPIKCVIVRRNWCPHLFSENMISQSERFPWVRLFRVIQNCNFFLSMFSSHLIQMCFLCLHCLQSLPFRRGKEIFQLKHTFTSKHIYSLRVWRSGELEEHQMEGLAGRWALTYATNIEYPTLHTILCKALRE